MFDELEPSIRGYLSVAWTDAQVVSDGVGQGLQERRGALTFAFDVTP